MLPRRMSYTYNLSHVNDELKSFRSFLRWMYVDQFDARYIMVSWSLFLLLSIFIFIASHFVLFMPPTTTPMI
ncbi:hypothetical protein GW17_00017860 [Ensete ventricosum]|nr:hypothetical protein GW17_00017860 [Ensete ventricosum]